MISLKDGKRQQKGGENHPSLQCMFKAGKR